MAEPARQHGPDAEAVPETVSHEEKTVEVPAVLDPVPEPVADRDTQPVRSSLETMLRHEMLRQLSSRNDG